MLELIYRRIEGVLKSVVSRISAKLTRLKRLPQDIAKKAKDLLKDVINFIIRRPSEISDYVKLGGSYIAKRALLAWILLAAAAVLAVVWFAVPLIRGAFFTTRLVVNTPQFHTASGKAEVYTEDGARLYSGIMKDGKADGDGKLYQNDILVYQGEFADNEYNGSGRLYDESGRLVYAGEFSDSLYNGTGSEYYPNGSVRTAGTYVSGMLEGEASLYSEDKELLYSGGFSAGKFNGRGELYEDGQLVYKGDFLNGEQTGEGTLYQNGEMIYSGGFLAGKYSGSGILYRYKENMRLEGVFEDGCANGNARLYSSDGEMLYSGAMSRGEIAYLSYAAADRQQAEQCFTEKAVVKELGDKAIVHYPQLGAGFIFNADGKTDRIVITGAQQLLNAEAGTLRSEFSAPGGAVKYSEYSFSPTKTDIRQMSYLGIQPPVLLDTVKYIRNNIFLKLYYSGGSLLFYEIGVI